MAATSWPPSLNSRLEMAAQSMMVEALPARFQHFARSCASVVAGDPTPITHVRLCRHKPRTANTFAIRMRQNRVIMIVLKATSLLLALLLPAAAQHHPAMTAEKPVVLYKGLGVWKHPIATRNAEAQKFFDQGLALLYGFNRYESLRSFRRAAELDPQS